MPPCLRQRQENRQAGARWAPIVSSAEKLLARLSQPDPDGEVAKDIAALEAKMDDVAQHSPVIPQAFVKKNGIDAAYPWQLKPTGRRNGVQRHRWVRSQDPL